MESFKSLIIVIALTALFAFSLIIGGYTLQIDNGLNSTILNDPVMKSFNSSVVSSLNDFKSSSDVQLNASLAEQGEEQNYEGAVSLGSIFHSLTTFGGFILGFGGSLIGLLGRLGVDLLIQNVLIAILGVIIILLFWRLWKGGS